MSVKFILATLVALAPSVALAHASFEKAETAPGVGWKGVLRVPHGCAGKPTNVVRVSIPEGVIDVKPMPKAGWSLATAKGPYSQAYPLFGKSVADGVKEIVWSGGSLPDDQYDEFVFVGRAAAVPAGGAFFFPTVQECGADKVAWTDLPASGQDAHALKSPAPSLKVIAQAPAAHDMQAGHDMHAGHGTPQAAPADQGGRPTSPPSVAPARVYRIGDLTIENPWTRATPKGAAVAGGFMKIVNAGKTPDTLVGGSFPGAGRFQIHEMTVVDGVMKMRELPAGLVIPAGQSVELKPGSYHVMMMDLAQPVEQGAPIKGKLRFEKAGEVEVDYDVAKVGAAAPQGGHQH